MDAFRHDHFLPAPAVDIRPRGLFGREPFPRHLAFDHDRAAGARNVHFKIPVAGRVQMDDARATKGTRLPRGIPFAGKVQPLADLPDGPHDYFSLGISHSPPRINLPGPRQAGEPGHPDIPAFRGRSGCSSESVAMKDPFWSSVSASISAFTV